MTDSDFCFWHDPVTQKDADQARALGRSNRKKEHALAGIYEVEGLESVEQIRRVLEVALMGELGMENSHNRARVLIAVASAAARLLEVGELEKRVAGIEAALEPRLPRPGDRKRRYR